MNKTMGCMLWAVGLIWVLAMGPAWADTSASGQVTPSNPDSWDHTTSAIVGNTADGIVEIDGGSAVETSITTLGYQAGSTGTVTLNGTGTTFGAGTRLIVGHGGTGEVEVTTGAVLETPALYGGYQPGSSSTITIQAATINVADDALIGYGGSGTLKLDQGGYLYSRNTVIGVLTGADGRIELTDSSTWSGSGSLFLGQGGSARVDVGSGSHLYTSSLFANPANLYGAGSVLAYGGVLDASLSLHAGSLQQSIPLSGGGTLEFSPMGHEDLGAGYQGSGSLTITTSVSSKEGVLGYQAGSVGEAVVDGPDAAWLLSGPLYVGRHGAGTLTLSDGGRVVTPTLFGALDKLSGDGTVQTSSAVLDDAVVIHDSSALIFSLSGTGTLEISLSGSGVLGAGHQGQGELLISSGASVASEGGMVGYAPGASGTVTLDAGGWQVTGDVSVGHGGVGSVVVDGGALGCENLALGYDPSSQGSATITVKVQHDPPSASEVAVRDTLSVGVKGTGDVLVEGGRVSANQTELGNYPGSFGRVHVTGGGLLVGGEWLTLGKWGAGRLEVTAGARATGDNVYVNSRSSVVVDAGSQIEVLGGSGTLTNEGDLWLVAGADQPDAKVFQPILAGTLDGSGEVRTLGVTWDPVTGEAVVTSAVEAASGEEQTLDLSVNQRVVATDAASGWQAGAAFGPTPTHHELLTTLTTSEGVSLEALLGQLTPGQQVAGAWDVAYSGGPENDAYVSIAVGAGTSLLDLDILRFDGGSWSVFEAKTANVSGSYASFFIEEPGTYAVLVPEPTAALLVLMGAAALLARRLRLDRLSHD